MAKQATFLVFFCLIELSWTKLTAQGNSENHVDDNSNKTPQMNYDVLLNRELDELSPSSVYAPDTDAGTQPPFKYPFSFARRAVYSGGWNRQVTVRELPIATSLAGVQMRLVKGGVRELHWHVSAEWAYVITGCCRITAVAEAGLAYVADIKEGDLWFFPGGVPHSLQGVGDDGCFFVLVFDDGNFDPSETFMVTDWLRHVPKHVLAKNFQTKQDVFNKIPPISPFIFAAELPRSFGEEWMQAINLTGVIQKPLSFRASKMEPTIIRDGGNIKIVDARNFWGTNIAAAIVTLGPGALRELHWHPNADEWNYFVRGKARVGVFSGNGVARTMDFQEGDVGYILKSTGHYIENTGEHDLVFLEIFDSPIYQDISLASWLAHTPPRIVNQNIHTGEDFLQNINKTSAFIVP